MSKISISKRVLGTGAAAAVAAGVGLAVTAQPAHADVWDRVAACESGGNWGISTGNGYYGGLQFTPSTWAANGGKGSASSASKAEQKRVAQNVLKTQGPGAWPVCGPKAGLSRSNGGSSSAAATTYSQRSYTSKSSTSKSSTKQSSWKKSSPVKSSSVKSSYTPRRTSGYSSHTSYVPKRATSHTYVVKQGDTLNKIAARYGVKGGWESLYQANRGHIANPNLIFVGQVLHF